VFPIKNHDGEIINYASVNRDITDEMKLKEQLQQKQRLESIGQMASGVAHDFNNILSVIMGYSEMALSKIEPDHVVWNYLEEVSRAGKRARDLTRQLLAFSRKQIIEPKIVSAAIVISDLEPILKKMVGEEISLSVKHTRDLNPIKADPSQLEQVLINLVLNARDAILQVTDPEADKSIHIVTSESYVSKDVSSLSLDLIPGSYLVIEVQDRGIGISPEIFNQIFDPFFTTKEVGKGTGLGLSTVYGIVKQNRGTIEFSSNKEDGTIFRVFWPSHAQPLTREEELVSIKNMGMGSETIMAVEDDTAVRTYIESVFQTSGYEVIIAKSGAEALEKITDQNIKIDLLFTDVVMPEMNGKELAVKFRQKFPDIKILFASGYTDEIVQQEDQIINESFFIQKPYTAGSLGEMIRTILDKDIHD
jgi:nitrogen-specific signal transduction histidine kinase/CheY-like chemotaxis protein